MGLLGRYDRATPRTRRFVLALLGIAVLCACCYGFSSLNPNNAPGASSVQFTPLATFATVSDPVIAATFAAVVATRAAEQTKAVSDLTASAPSATPTPPTATPSSTPRATATRPPVNTLAPEPPAGSHVGRVGERLEGGGMALTIVKATRLAKFEPFGVPKAGNNFIVLDALVESTTRDNAPYNPLYFKVKDADGFEYDQSFFGLDPSLKSGNLAPGGKARGNVTFELRIAAKGLVVTFEPIVLFGDYVPLTVALGQ